MTRLNFYFLPVVGTRNEGWNLSTRQRRDKVWLIKKRKGSTTAAFLPTVGTQDAETAKGRRHLKRKGQLLLAL